jgi:pilus assembly protein FimV
MDIGADSGQVRIADATAGVEFELDEELADSGNAATIPAMPADEAAESPAAESSETVESKPAEQDTAAVLAIDEVPTVPLLEAEATLASLDEATDAVADIDLDDLDLDLDGLDLPQTAADDEDVTTLASLEDLEDATDAIAEIDLDDLDLDLDGLGLPQADADNDDVATLANLDELDEATDAIAEIDFDDLDLDGLAAPQTAADDDEATTLTDDDDADFAAADGQPKDLLTGNGSMDESGEMPGLADSTEIDLDIDNLTAAMKIMEVGGTAMNQLGADTTVEQPAPGQEDIAADLGEMPDLADSTDMDLDLDNLTATMVIMEVGGAEMDQMGADATVEQPAPKQEDVVPDAGASATNADDSPMTETSAPDDPSDGLHDARTMTEVGTKLDLARAYVDMGDPSGARSILDEVLDEGDESQRQQAQQLLESLPS